MDLTLDCETFWNIFLFILLNILGNIYLYFILIYLI